MKHKTLSVLALSALGVSMMAAPAFAAHEGTAYQGTLSALNGDTGSGEAYLEVSEDGETMTVRVTAENLELDMPHAMHGHGRFDPNNLDADPAATMFEASACPDMSADANGDGILSVAEGVPDYGQVLTSLTTTGGTTPAEALAVGVPEGDNLFTDSTGTSIDYEREIEIPNAMKDELGNIHIVVHGTDVDDNGDFTNDDGVVSSLNEDLPIDATAPALCGELTAVSSGQVDTGAGGTATEGNGTESAAVLGLGGLALAGAVALRRRGEAA